MDFTQDFFSRFSSEMGAATSKEMASGDLLHRLTIMSDGVVHVRYAPFEYVSPDASLVVVGITPGRTQALNALTAASAALKAGKSPSEAVRIAKLTASFSGSMRTSLVHMLDHIGLARVLGLTTCAGLFDAKFQKVHFTSALRYPVFVGDANYNGTPDMLNTPLLRSMIDDCLGKEAQMLSEAVWLPLGSHPARALEYLCSRGLIDRRRVFQGLPHPSGANSERIAYFLGRKARQLLSTKTNASVLDACLRKLRTQTEGLRIS